MIKDLTGCLLDGKFKVLALAGSGGMGLVYRALQIDLNRIVAVKVLRTEMLLDTDAAARFEREAKLISKLSHKNIATFYRYGFLDDLQPYIAMEFLEGKSLDELIRENGPFDWQQSVEICIQVCSGMEYAHKNNVVHRDLKPSNVFVSDEKTPAPKVKIVDFGLAKLIDESSYADIQKLTKTGLLIGSVRYLSPEQCQGRTAADCRSDVYALGCVLYEMTSGRPPFDADNPIGLLHKHVHESVQALSKVVPSNSFAALDSIVLKALAKDPPDRFQSMEDFQNALASLFSTNKNVPNSSTPLTKRSAFPKLAIPVVIITLLGLLSYYCLFNTSAGTIWRCNLELNSRNTRDNDYLKWLAYSDSLKKTDPESARQISEEVLRKIPTD